MNLLFEVISLLICIGIPVLGGIYFAVKGKGYFYVSYRNSVFCGDADDSADPTSWLSEDKLGVVYDTAIQSLLYIYGDCGILCRCV